jgi:hypothetical protein
MLTRRDLNPEPLVRYVHGLPKSYLDSLRTFFIRYSICCFFISLYLASFLSGISYFQGFFIPLYAYHQKPTTPGTWAAH